MIYHAKINILEYASRESNRAEFSNSCPALPTKGIEVMERFESVGKEDTHAQSTKLASPEEGIALDVEATGDGEANGRGETTDGPPEDDDGLPIDRGWAWVVLAGALEKKLPHGRFKRLQSLLAGSFLNIVLIVGYARSIGILFVEYLKIFEASATTTTLFMGVMQATFSLASLFSMNLILQFLGVRKTVVLGGAITSLGMLTAVFAPSITFLICTHSILTGIGHSMIHSPALVLIGQYFKKRRGLATAISMSGISLGGCIFPPIVRYFIDEFGIRGSMLLLSGLTMNVMVGGLLFRPLESFRKRVTNVEQLMGSAKFEEVDLLSNEGGNIRVGDIDSYGRVDRRETTDEGLTYPLLSIETEIKLEEMNSETRVFKRVRLVSVHSHSSNPANSSDTRINIYRSNPELISMSMLNITEESIKEDESKKRKTVCNYLKVAVVSLDFTLFKYPMFQLIIVTSCFAIVFALVGIYIPALAIEKGIPLTEASLLITIYSSVDFVSRLAVGYIADLKCIKVHHLVSIGLFIAGTVPHFAAFYNSFGLMVLCAASFGLFGGFYNCLVPVIIFEFMGQLHMAKVLGFVAVFHGLTLSLTHPILGAIRDLTGSYQICFNYIGACNYLTAIFLLCEPLIRQRATRLKLITDQKDQPEIKQG